MLHCRVPFGPAPVLASDFQPTKPHTQGVPQQATQAKPAAPLQQLAINTHEQQPQHSAAARLPPQDVKSAAPSAALDQQFKQDTKPVHSPQGVAVPGYATGPDQHHLA